MSLAITRIPGVLFTDNAHEVEFRKRGVLATVGGYASLTLVFKENGMVLPAANAPNTGETLVLDIGGVSAAITFTFSGADGDADKLDPYDTSSLGFGGNPNYLMLLASQLQRHPFFLRNYYVDFLGFDLTNDRGIINITSKQRGTDYNIAVNGSSTMSYSSADSGSVTIAANDEPLTNYKLSVSLLMEKDRVYHPDVVQLFDIEATGQIDYDNDEMVIRLYELPEMAKLMADVDIPYAPFKIQQVRKSIINMAITATEEYEGSNKAAMMQLFGDLTQNVPIIQALHGGMEVEQQGIRNFIYWLFNVSANTVKFLSLQPGRSKVVTKEQPEWLTWLFADFGTNTIEFVVHYSDGTTQTATRTLDVLVDNAIRYPTGFHQNKLETLNPGGVEEVKYTAQAFTGSVVSELFTYIIDNRPVNDNRYFIYRNAVGQIDTLRCYGVNKFTIKRKGETRVSVVTSDTNMNTGSIEMVYNEYSREWAMRTGYLLNREEKEFLTDFIKSTYIAEVVMPLAEPELVTDGPSAVSIHKEQRYRSVVVLQDTIEMWEEDEGAWAMEWRMKLAHDEVNYGNLPVLEKYWYDSIIEFTIVIDEVTGATPKINVYTPGTNVVQVQVNDHIYELTPGAPWTGDFEVEEGKSYHVVVRGQRLTEVNIQAIDVTADIDFRRIETESLAYLTVLFFRTVFDDYLIGRIGTLWSLVDLVIWCDNLKVDGMLASLITLLNEDIGLLNSIDFSFTAPDAPGVAMREHLIVRGIAVTTA